MGCQLEAYWSERVAQQFVMDTMPSRCHRCSSITSGMKEFWVTRHLYTFCIDRFAPFSPDIVSLL